MNPFRTSKARLIVTGILMLILGITALILPIATSIELGLFVGVLFIVAGAVQLVHAARFPHETGKFMNFVLGLVALAAGGVTLWMPTAGAMGITLVIAVYLLLSAVTKAFLAFDIRPAQGWGWGLVSAAFSAVLGAFLLIAFPWDSLIVPGVIFGVDMIVYGSMLVLVASRPGRRESISSAGERPSRAA